MGADQHPGRPAVRHHLWRLCAFGSGAGDRNRPVPSPPHLHDRRLRQHGQPSGHGLCGPRFRNGHDLPRDRRFRLGRDLHGRAPGSQRRAGRADTLARRGLPRGRDGHRRLALLLPCGRDRPVARLGGGLPGQRCGNSRRVPGRAAALSAPRADALRHQSAGRFPACVPQPLRHGLYRLLRRAYLGNVRGALLGGRVPDVRGDALRPRAGILACALPWSPC